MSEITFDVVSFDVVVGDSAPVVGEYLLVEGPQGPKGNPGDSTFGYQHVQSGASASWSITHNLGRYPYSSEITTNSGEVVHADVVYPTTSTVAVTFASPQAGILRLT